MLARCATLPGAECGFPPGDGTGVFTVEGTMSALDDEPGRLTVKCEPGYAVALIAEHEAVVPGHHMDERHWITVTLGSAPPVELVDDLVAESHELVVGVQPTRGGTPDRADPGGGCRSSTERSSGTRLTPPRPTSW